MINGGNDFQGYPVLYEVYLFFSSVILYRFFLPDDPGSPKTIY